jgi:hypothetical protein
VAQPSVARFFAAIAYRASLIVGELDNSNSEPPVKLDQVDVVLQWMGPLKLEHNCQFSSVLGFPHVVDGQRNHKPVIVVTKQLVEGSDTCDRFAA